MMIKIGHRPEHHLLPGVVFADFRQIFLVIGQHVAQMRQPGSIFARHKFAFQNRRNNPAKLKNSTTPIQG